MPKIHPRLTVPETTDSGTQSRIEAPVLLILRFGCSSGINLKRGEEEIIYHPCTTGPLNCTPRIASLFEPASEPQTIQVNSRLLRSITLLTIATHFVTFTTQAKPSSCLSPNTKNVFFHLPTYTRTSFRAQHRRRRHSLRGRN